MIGINITLNTSFDEAIRLVTAALKEQGFGVLSDLDMQATMKEKLGVQMPPYRILGACNPSLAYKAVKAEPDIGLLLPCNVVVREEAPGYVTVAFVDPQRIAAMVDKPEIHQVADDATQRLQRARDSLSR
jgi:uncharacterized protein (DUF302 family)